MFKRYSVFLQSVVLVSLLYPATLQAQNENWYLGFGLNVFDIKINNESFFPKQLNLNGGLWIRPGIGIEVQAGATAGSYETDGFELTADNYISASIRWQSLVSQKAQAYILTGFGQLSLDGAIDDTGFPGDESFNGPHVGLGVLFSISDDMPWSAGLGYTHYFLQDELTIESIDAVIHYDF